jgi:hypothetical protein
VHEVLPGAVSAGDVEVGVALPEVFSWLLLGEGDDALEEVIGVACVAGVHLELPIEVKSGV